MLKNIKLLITLFFLAGNFITCKDIARVEEIDKNIDSDIDIDINTSSVDFSNIENLYAQPLLIIRKCVVGEWEWISYHNGITGFITIRNGLIQITDEKMIGLFGVDIQNYTWRLQKVREGIDGIVTYVAWNTENDEPICFFDRIQNDTMYVYRCWYHNNEFIYNALHHILIKITDNNRK